VGGNLVRALLDQGRQVRALVRSDERALQGLDLERVRGDVLDLGSLRAAFDGAQVVYHLAAVISVDGDRGGQVREVNIRGTRNVVAACRQAGVKRLVHFSSIHAFRQEPLAQVLDERRPAVSDPDCLSYDLSKAGGEAEVQAGVAQGLDAVIVNPTAVLGPHDYKPSLMGEVILNLCRRRMPALVDGGFDWVDVRDVVAGALAAEARGRTGERYLLSGQWRPFKDLAALVAQANGVRAPRLVAPMSLARLGAPFVVAWSHVFKQRPLYTSESLRVLRTSNRAVSHQKAAQELGYQPRPLPETVQDTVTWFKNRGAF
jgi:dihydroflavonol-4-reductase